MPMASTLASSMLSRIAGRTIGTETVMNVLNTPLPLMRAASSSEESVDR